jgi:hypothetical protein
LFVLHLLKENSSLLLATALLEMVFDFLVFWRENSMHFLMVPGIFFFKKTKSFGGKKCLRF